MKIAVIGGGEIGNAVAQLCKEELFLGIVDIDPSRSTIESSDLAEADVVLVAVPSTSFRHTLEQNKPCFKESAVIVALTKGVEEGTGKLMPEIMEEILPMFKWALISGPMVAEEIMEGKPTRAYVASKNDEAFKILKEIFNQERIDLEYTNEIKATALLASLKNVYALGAGVLAGLDAGINLEASFITASLNEMKEILKREGLKEEMVDTLPGLGDLLATGFNPDSKNRSVGESLARSQLKGESEGVHTVRGLSQRLDTSSLKLFQTIKDIVEGVKAPNELINATLHG